MRTKRKGPLPPIEIVSSRRELVGPTCVVCGQRIGVIEIGRHSLSMHAAWHSVSLPDGRQVVKHLACELPPPSRRLGVR